MDLTAPRGTGTTSAQEASLWIEMKEMHSKKSRMNIKGFFTICLIYWVNDNETREMDSPFFEKLVYCFKFYIVQVKAKVKKIEAN